MMLKHGSRLNPEKTPVAVAVAVPITNEHENTEEVNQDAGYGGSATSSSSSYQNEHNLFTQCFITAYSTKKKLFTKKMPSLLHTGNYQKSISLIQNLRSPEEVSDENLDDTFLRFEELIDFFLTVPPKSTATLEGLNHTLPMIFESYMTLSGFYPKLLEKIKKYETDIQNDQAKLESVRKNKNLLETKLKMTKAQLGIAWSTSEKETKIQEKQTEIETLEDSIYFLNRKKELIANYQESLKNIEAAASCFPNHICDLHWYAEVTLSALKNITDKNKEEIIQEAKEEIIQAATEKNVEKLLDFVSCNLEIAQKININPIIIFNIIKRMQSLTYDQLTTCQHKLNNARQEYLNREPNGRHLVGFDNMRDFISNKLLESPAPSAPPLFANPMNVEQNLAIENLTPPAPLDVEEEQEEFYEAVDDSEGLKENINLGKLLVNQWKNENLVKAAALQQIGEEAANERINGLGI